MGGGIAMACANAGHHGRPDATPSTSGSTRHRDASARTTTASVKRGRFTPEEVDERLGADPHRRSATTASATADLDHRGRVREHGAQEAGVRRSSTPRQDPAAILATNTSTLDIDADRRGDARGRRRSSACTSSARRNVMRLRRDRARRQATAPATLATALALAKRLGKVGVVVATARASSATA